MNLIFLGTRLLLLLHLACTGNTINGRKNIQDNVNSTTTMIPHRIKEIVPIPGITSQIPTNPQSNQIEIALLVMRKSLGQKLFSATGICGGILVSTTIVITAAHCFYDPHGWYRMYPNMFHVAYRRAGDDEMVGIPAKSIAAHPLYNENGWVCDIGTIRLSKSMDVGGLMNAGQLIPLAQKSGNEAHLVMLVFSAENGTMQTQRVAARLANKFRCQEAYHKWGYHTSPEQLCIEQVHLGFSYGGESAILLWNHQPIAVLSFKFDITSGANSLPYIFTELSRYTEFIQREIHADDACRLKPSRTRICSSILYVVISMAFRK